MKKRINKRVWWVWHRRLGIISAAFVVFLSVTGLVLNHSVDAGLDRKHIRNPVILDLYHIEIPAAYSVNLSGKSIVNVAEDLFLDQNLFGSCDGKLVGALTDQALALFYIVCESEIQIYSSDMQLVEKISRYDGLSIPIQGIGVIDQLIVVNSQKRFYSASLDDLMWQETQVDANEINWNLPAKKIDKIPESIFQQEFSSGITWERLVLDIHAGRFFGRYAPWIMDVMSVAFLILAITGIYMWLKSGRKNSKKRSRTHHN
ncbi:PepSY-associated TM helix domain-containing protein [Teredinibacter sp. KSP-S5-2]|uniref:PepSY-associated TM helix domain-containing protein n=1 Tax=Teredinibacter sp. KSP-S5-2 TaxID=3034506 RepID=UPI0029345CE8|nr:PepSY-associated TM helix domain-containing protein [Teredinibacter sp. KSP-S5-2]WNO10176.1 PepSY-associated TM helix domain-containing protein [Teredinibacter sp. KSP-S5-2]